jgi:hypothetical protein
MQHPEIREVDKPQWFFGRIQWQSPSSQKVSRTISFANLFTSSHEFPMPVESRAIGVMSPCIVFA